jgi:hypothetical protein
MSTEGQPPKSRRRSVAKSTTKPDERTIEFGLYLSLDAARCLGVTAIIEGLDRCQSVVEPVLTHPRTYVVQV